MTLIEVLMAGVILTIGLLGLAVLMADAITQNARNRADLTSTMIAQAVLEQVASGLGGVTGQVVDCAGNVTSIDGTPGGAVLISDGSIDDGKIDWSKPLVAGYHSDYVVCANTANTTANGQQTTYEVRWNVTRISGLSSNSTNQITVGVRPKQGQADNKRFAPPMNLTVYLGPNAN